MKKKVPLVVLLIGFVLLSYFVFLFIRVGNPVSVMVCKVNGGKWVLSGFREMRFIDKSFCDYPPPDIGKSCSENADCAEVCMPTDQKDSEGYILGRCAEANCSNSLDRKTRLKPQPHPNPCDVF